MKKVITFNTSALLDSEVDKLRGNLISHLKNAAKGIRDSLVFWQTRGETYVQMAGWAKGAEKVAIQVGSLSLYGDVVLNVTELSNGQRLDVIRIIDHVFDISWIGADEDISLEEDFEDRLGKDEIKYQELLDRKAAISEQTISLNTQRHEFIKLANLRKPRKPLDKID